MYIADKSFKGLPRFVRGSLAGFGQTDPNELPCGECTQSNWDGRGFGPRGTPTHMWGGETPTTKFDILPHWVPSGGSPINGLSWPAIQQKYRNLNLEIKSKIEAKMAQAGARPWGQEVLDIYNDLMGVDAWVRARAVGGAKHTGPSGSGGGPPGDHEQPDLVLYTAYKKAEKLIDGIAPGLTEQEEAAITEAMQPAAAGMPYTDTESYSSPMPINKTTMLMIGGGAVFLLIAATLILK